MTPQAQAAADTAAAGWPVHPLRPGEKRPLSAHGVKDATTDPAIIRQHWSAHPRANIGIALPPDVVALDIDVKGGVNGFDSLAALERAHGPLPATRKVKTPSGGQHLYFSKPAGRRIKNTVGVRPGLDVRTHGGYLVGPGSVIDGRGYELLADCKPAPAPAWLLDLLAPPAPSRDTYADKAMERAHTAVANAPEGQRNEELNGAAFGLARIAAADRLDWHRAAAQLEQAALAAGLQPAEIRATLESARAAGERDPNFEGLPGQVDPDTGELTPAPAQHPLARLVDMQGPPRPPAWLLPGFFVEGLTVIAGQPGIGKTTALLPLACGAAGIHEADWPLAPRHWRHVVYVTEDVPQALRILHGLADHLGTTMKAIAERLHLVEAHRMPAADLVLVGEIYRERYTRTVEGVELLPLVVLDTQAAAIHLENENDNAEASAAVAALKQQFAGLPVWLVAHVAKSHLNRSDVENFSSRGAGAWGGDANATAFLVKDAGKRWLVLGKRRFEPRWSEAQLESHWREVDALDPWGQPERLHLRWAIARPAENRQEHAAMARQAQAQADEAELRQEIRDAVQIAWQQGHPLSRAAVRATIKRKTTEVVACIDRLVHEGWLQVVHVPREIRAHPSRADFLVNLDTTERENMRRGQPLPPEKSAIPDSWKKAIPPVPERNDKSAQKEKKEGDL